MISTEETIKENLGELWYVLMNAKMGFSFADYLFNPPTEKENDYMKHYGSQMVSLRNYAWRNYVLDLATLYSKEDKRSIIKFLNNVSNDGPLCKVIPYELISKWRNILEEHQEQILYLKKIRDKVFGHADYRYHESLQYYHFDKNLEKLIFLTEEFITDIFSHFDSGVVHDNNFVKFDFLEILADHEEHKRAKLLEEFKNIRRD